MTIVNVNVNDNCKLKCKYKYKKVLGGRETGERQRERERQLLLEEHNSLQKNIDNMTYSICCDIHTFDIYIKSC